MPLKRPFELPWTLTVGDYPPEWTLPSSLGHILDSGYYAGHPVVVCVLGAEASEALVGLAEMLGEAHGALSQAGMELVVIVPAARQAVKVFATRLQLPVPVCADENGAVSAAYGAVRAEEAGGAHRLRPATRTVLLDASGRVAAVSEANEADDLRRDLEGWITAAASRPERQAPVLLIPNVLPEALCAELIQLWHTAGNEESGFMRQVDGRTVGVMDHTHKIRRDHYLGEGEVQRRVMHHIYHRVRPEIRRAYQFEATRFEDFRVVCYDAERGGYFRPHRDNTTDGTAHRAFAMTLNLNTGEYEGGGLRFPEYGPQVYRPRTGEAVVFSCSLFHEATDVTAGRRFALLSFLYGEREAQLREQIARRRGAEYRARR